MMTSETSGNLIGVIGWVLVHQLWQAAAIYLVLRLTRPATSSRSPQARHAISLLAYAALIASIGVTAMIYATDDARIDPSAVIGSAPGGSATDAGMHRDFSGGLRYKPLTPVNMLDSVAGSIAPYLPTVVFVWTVVIGCLMVRHACGLRDLRRLVSVADELDRLTESRLIRLAQQIGLSRRVRFLETRRCVSPITLGVFRPVVLLPAAIVTGYSIEEIEILVAHELAHIRRFDYVVNASQVVVETLLFFNPFVWLLSAAVTHSRELCCDEVAGRALGGAEFYAKTLVKVFDGFPAPPAPAVAAVGGHLLDRVATLRRRRFAARGGRWTLTAFLACLAVVGIAAGAVINEARERQQRRAMCNFVESDFFEALFDPPSPRPEFEDAYVHAIAAVSLTDPTNESLDRLIEAANSGPDLDVVWRAYLPLIGPTRYPTVDGEYPGDWQFGDVQLHRQLVRTIWHIAKERPPGEARRRAVHAAIAVGFMRREESVAAALRPVLTDRRFAEVANLGGREVRLLRQYWVDTNERNAVAYDAATELCRQMVDGQAQPSAEHNARLVGEFASQTPAAAYVGAYASNRLGIRTTDALRSRAGNSDVLSKAIGAATEDNVPDEVQAFIRRGQR